MSYILVAKCKTYCMFVISESDMHSTFVNPVPYVVSCYIGPYYNKNGLEESARYSAEFSYPILS